jgi:L,D-peptidoglycan transpeptidase YkuD (ErfK/YbiS/YcfS/YnhG family)
MRGGDTSRLVVLAAQIMTAAACGYGTEREGASATAAPATVSTDASVPPLPGVVASARQLLIVTTPDWNTVAGRLRRYERSDASGTWQPVGEPVAIVVGKNGLAWDDTLLAVTDAPTKHEGDGRSPAGAFALGPAFGLAPREQAAWWKGSYVQETPTLECVDDPASRYYNQLVDRALVEPDWTSSEKMAAVGEAYRWGVVVEYNTTDIRRGKGSCIFLHIGGEQGKGTAGCTAMAAPSLDVVMRWLDPAAKPALVQMPAPVLDVVRAGWKLPA